MAAPAAVLHFTAGDERLGIGLTAAPFAWPRVLVAHLVAAVPLGLILAGWLRTLLAVRQSARAFWVALGVVAAGIAAFVGPTIGAAIAAADFGPVLPRVLRSTIALALVLPWCVFALEHQSSGRGAVHPGFAIGIGLGIAVIPCGMFAQGVIAARTEQASSLIRGERLLRAAPAIDGLCELGNEAPIGKQSPQALGGELSRFLAGLRQQCEAPFPADAGPRARMDRAMLMVRLDRLGDAAKLLKPLVPRNATPTLWLATVYRYQERWSESDALYRGLLVRLLSDAGHNLAAKDACLTAIEGLVFNARQEHRPDDAENVIRAGQAAIPSESAYFHFQLGLHYADGGRPESAIEHLREATTLDPTRFAAPANERIRQLRTHTPACLLPGH